MSSAAPPPCASRRQVRVSAIFAEQWDDGFGARGWKLDVPGAGPDVIATTPYTGERIPTSVFVHDLVDHHLCGFQLSGYLDEAGALIQLAQRTGSDPVPDFQQIIDEDLLTGTVEGRDWQTLLPAPLIVSIPTAASPSAGIQDLRCKLGDGLLRALFTAGFVREGWLRWDTARTTWEAHGLDYEARPRIALALQALFEWMDTRVKDHGWSHARGEFFIGNHAVEFGFKEPVADLHWVSVEQPQDPLEDHESN
ncbi:hypothetical protein [Ectothiorhodospira sp. BSL-9]|uniref:hypothetical protein n=1 Tax=Ectothiorhodospira sp. BSL-9 TaxID=1442136 RepID=UPI0007B44CBE|nr:hypothetical protein [Ectothiorhodospira sp. BSL-9]ANB01777.1 hypothetical protein ECTOBSL9_0969 [Ectothiorhodospira sp. BSL-9]